MINLLCVIIDHRGALLLSSIFSSIAYERNPSFLNLEQILDTSWSAFFNEVISSKIISLGTYVCTYMETEHTTSCIRIQLILL